VTAGALRYPQPAEPIVPAPTAARTCGLRNEEARHCCTLSHLGCSVPQVFRRRSGRHIRRVPCQIESGPWALRCGWGPAARDPSFGREAAGHDPAGHRPAILQKLGGAGVRSAHSQPLVSVASVSLFGMAMAQHADQQSPAHECARVGSSGARRGGTGMGVFRPSRTGPG
jgi:hypothetical protein